MKALLLALVMSTSGALAQDKSLPYYEIPPAPEIYTAGGVAARMIDGLGFRFYWATEGLRDQDLSFKPSAGSRTAQETIQHIYEMSVMIKNAAHQRLNEPDQSTTVSFLEMRKITLENLKAVSDRLRTSTDSDLQHYQLQFKRGEQTISFPFWNHINGPIEDCIWHVGQVVTLRRLSGNPFSDKVSLLSGKVIN